MPVPAAVGSVRVPVNIPVCPATINDGGPCSGGVLGTGQKTPGTGGTIAAHEKDAVEIAGKRATWSRRVTV